MNYIRVILIRYQKLILISCLILITLILVRYKEIDITSFDNEVVITNNDIDFYTKGVKVSYFNKQGKLDYIINSPNIEHYKLQDITNIISPLIIIYTDNYPWHIKADSAQVITNNKQIDFNGNLIINQDNNSVILTTDHLSLFPEQKRVINNIITNINNSNINIIADNGIDADLNTNILNLNKAKGVYNKDVKK